MKTLEEYVKENGYEVSDFTKEELEEIKKDLEVENGGDVVLDGFFSSFIRNNTSVNFNA